VLEFGAAGETELAQDAAPVGRTAAKICSRMSYGIIRIFRFEHMGLPDLSKGSFDGDTP